MKHTLILLTALLLAPLATLHATDSQAPNASIVLASKGVAHSANAVWHFLEDVVGMRYSVNNTQK
jgi:hypothetical protein